jgi:hypothetical protein
MALQDDEREERQAAGNPKTASLHVPGLDLADLHLVLVGVVLIPTGRQYARCEAFIRTDRCSGNLKTTKEMETK